MGIAQRLAAQCRGNPRRRHAFRLLDLFSLQRRPPETDADAGNGGMAPERALALGLTDGAAGGAAALPAPRRGMASPPLRGRLSRTARRRDGPGQNPPGGLALD